MANEINKAQNNILHLPYADASRSVRHVFVRDYVTDAQIGVWEHEKDTRQKVRISVDLSVMENTTHHDDQLDNVVCYNDIVINIQEIQEVPAARSLTALDIHLSINFDGKTVRSRTIFKGSPPFKPRKHI